MSLFDSVTELVGVSVRGSGLLAICCAGSVSAAIDPATSADDLAPVGQVVYLDRGHGPEGANTNDFFLFDESNYRSHFDPKDGLSLINYCRTAPECQLAPLDSAGNWGFDSDGLRLALRFAKTNFLPGERIQAEIILRNTSSNYWHKNTHTPLSDLSVDEFDIQVTHNRTPVKRVAPLALGSSWRSDGLYGRTQKKYLRELTAQFDMSEPGEYLVFVERKFPKRSGKGTTSVRSGNAVIQVVAGDSNTQSVGDRAIPTGDKNTGIGAMADNTASSVSKSSPQSRLSAATSREAFSGDAESSSVRMGQSADLVGKPAAPLNEEIVTQNGYGGIALLFLVLAGATAFLFFRRGR